jgi:hypothetical protein
MFKKLSVYFLCLCLLFPSTLLAQKSGSSRSGGGSSFKSSSSGSSFKSGSSSSKPSSSSGFGSSNKGSGKPSGSSGFGSSLSTSQKKDDSKTSYSSSNKNKPTTSTKPTTTTKSSPPPVTYKKPDSTKTYTPSTKQVNTIKSIPKEKVNNYSQRQNTFYNTHTTVYSSGPSFSDHFSPFLMGWMFSDIMSSHDRALWMYHHENDMDTERYKEMLAKDAQLQTEIDKLKAENVEKDPTYVPEKLKEDPDLMYSEDYVQTIHNHQEVPVVVSAPAPAVDGFSFGDILITLVLVVVSMFILWLVFVREF